MTMVSNPFSFSLLLVSLLASQTMALAACADKNSTSFVQTSCNRTLYPDPCYSSLSPYACKVWHDPVMLARFSMNVTIGSLKPLYVYINSEIRRTTSNTTSSSVVAALKDCKELITDAIDLVRKSEKEITGLETMVGSQVTWHIGNAQTWLSAAITDQSTCVDGFGDVSGGTKEEVEKEVRSKDMKAKQLTSISLALVNILVNS